jgi:hypothetical protein
MDTDKLSARKYLMTKPEPLCESDAKIAWDTLTGFLRILGVPD